MGGAVDGGLEIPHSLNRFPGYDDEADEFNAEVHRNHIFGKNIADYMTALQEEDEEAFKRQFSRYTKEGVSADTIEDMYKNCHAAIRDDPTPKEKSKEAFKGKRHQRKKRSRAQRQSLCCSKEGRVLKEH